MIPATRLDPRARRVAAAAALGLAAVLGLARWLVPDPSGRGTHRQLGLPPCAFLVTTGRPCPTCGMTTAFAWSVRGRWARAWAANPAGLPLAASCALAIPWLLAASATGRAVGSASLSRPLTLGVLAMTALTLLAWIFRVIPGREAG